jgi:uncharacterized membrane protein
MEWALFSNDGFYFVLRWFHTFFGIIWIGLLYYFNFVQGSFMAETDAGAKSQVTQKLLPRALWWFRYGALGTFLVGLTILIGRWHQNGTEFFASSYGVTILTGATLGTLMFLNVWLIIWPNQKIVIANAVATASGGAANPAAAAAGPKALLASRTNTLFSVPMLFYMAGARHLPLAVTPESSLGLLTLVLGVIIFAIEANAIKGKLGPLTTVRGVITSGFVLTVVLYLAMEIVL